MKQVNGQLGLFDINVKPINEKNIGLGEPCETCDVEWCSAACFQRRGYMWSMWRRFEKDQKGKPLRKSLESRECKVTRFDSQN